MRKNIEKKPVNKKNTDNRFDNFDYEENREELPFADSKRVIILDEKRLNEDYDELEAEYAREELLRKVNEGVPDEDESEVVSKTVVRIRRKRKRNKKRDRLIALLVISSMVLAFVIGAVVLSVNNNYETPIRIYEEYLNKESYSDEELSFAYANGLGEDGLRELRNRMRDSYNYIKKLDATISLNEEMYQERCSLYGDDFTYTVSIEDVMLISPEELKSYAVDFDLLIEDISNISISNSDNEMLVEALYKATGSLRGADVSKGYKLGCIETVDGSKLSAPEKREVTFTVLKINGRWILWDEIYTILKVQY